MITDYENWKKIWKVDMTFENKKSEGIVITDLSTTSTINFIVGRNIYKENKNSKFYWFKDWKITPPNKIKTNSSTVDNIISTQASSYFRRKNEFSNIVDNI